MTYLNYTKKIRKVTLKNTVLSEESKVKSDTIRGHRLNNIYNPIFELTQLTPEQIAMIDEVRKLCEV